MQANSDLSERRSRTVIFTRGFSTAREVSQSPDEASHGRGAQRGRRSGRARRDAFTKGRHALAIYLPLYARSDADGLVRAGAKTYAIPAVMVEQVLQLRRQNSWSRDRSRQTYADGTIRSTILPALPRSAEASRSRNVFSPTLYLASGTNSIALHWTTWSAATRNRGEGDRPQLQRIAGITGGDGAGHWRKSCSS